MYCLSSSARSQLFWLWLSAILTMALFTQVVHAARNDLLTQGIAAYKNLDFDKAIQRLTAYLNTSPKKANRLEALRFLTICYINNNQEKQGLETWKQAVRLDPQVKIVTGQPPRIHRLLEKTRRELLSKKTVSRTPSLSRKRATPSQTKQPKQRFRHTLSVIAWGVAALSLGGALTLGVLAQSSYAASMQSDGTFDSAQNAQTFARTSTSLWIAGGAVAAAGLGLFFWELSRPTPAAQAALPHSRTTLLVEDSSLQP